MARKIVQHARGTTAQHSAFTGQAGELTVDTDKVTAVVHDGSTAGGVPLQRADGVPINLKEWGAVGDGVADDTAIIASLVALGRPLFAPDGTYLVNLTLTAKTVIRGSRNTLAVFKPYNVALPIITYRNNVGDWAYASVFENISFESTGKTGIGFAMARGAISSYVALDEVGGRISFFNCRFAGLEKGFQSLFGNIGVNFIHCNFAGNKYGVYCLNNKSSATVMHAGCKYFLGGEIASNDCGVYIHDTSGALGQFAFRGMVMETNTVALYCYATGTTYTPVLLDDVWNESNGEAQVSGAATVTIDAWSGTTRSDQTITARALIFDGSNYSPVIRGGNASNTWAKGTNIVVQVEKARWESVQSIGGGPMVADGTNSSIEMNDCSTVGCFQESLPANVLCRRPVQERFTVDVSAAVSLSRAFPSPRWSAIGANASLAGLKLTLAAQSNFDDITGSVENDGIAAATCNEYSKAFTVSGLSTLTAGSLAMTAGWYVFQLGVKSIAGTHRFYFWDQNVNQFIRFQVPVDSKWYVVSAIGYMTGSATLALNVGRSDGIATSVFRLSGMNVLKFASQQEAREFAAKGLFIA